MLLLLSGGTGEAVVVGGHPGRGRVRPDVGWTIEQDDDELVVILAVMLEADP